MGIFDRKQPEKQERTFKTTAPVMQLRPGAEGHITAMRSLKGQIDDAENMMKGAVNYMQDKTADAKERRKQAAQACWLALQECENIGKSLPTLSMTISQYYPGKTKEINKAFDIIKRKLKNLQDQKVAIYQAGKKSTVSAKEIKNADATKLILDDDLETFCASSAGLLEEMGESQAAATGFCNQALEEQKGNTWDQRKSG